MDCKTTLSHETDCENRINIIQNIILIKTQEPLSSKDNSADLISTGVCADKIKKYKF